MTLPDGENVPLVHIGWVLAADERSAATLNGYDAARRRLEAALAEQFPQFEWKLEPSLNRAFAPRGALDPLGLLELGLREKTAQAWDYALVLVPNELTSRGQSRTLGVPSSALEVAALSSATFALDDEFADRVAGLALHLLGHLWNLEHDEAGPMVPLDIPERAAIAPYPPAQAELVGEHLAEVADARLEERSGRYTRLGFLFNTISADPRGLAQAVLGYAPWRLPFRMGRLTGAAAVTLVLLLMTAETWEVGVNFAPPALAGSAVVAILAATLFIFWGQNLSSASQEARWREQLTRTRVVLFATLLIGIIALWGVLFLVALGAAALVPGEVTSGWVGRPLGLGALARFSALLAILGVLAAALGGNLENAETLKARLYFDEET